MKVRMAFGLKYVSYAALWLLISPSIEPFFVSQVTLLLHHHTSLPCRRFVDSTMGGISFFQASYWSFTVMSTVGFGDYSPTTVSLRLLSSVCNV